MRILFVLNLKSDTSNKTGKYSACLIILFSSGYVSCILMYVAEDYLYRPFVFSMQN